ncbi:MAG: FCD domain-containing protein [Ruminococcus sp.]|nr:FCD domain-containing protein [Ruminococcus sp.]
MRKVDVGFYLNLVVPSLFLDEHDSVNILQFMKAIQAERVRFACRKATEEDIRVLEDLLEKMKDSGDYEDYFTYDIGF